MEGSSTSGEAGQKDGSTVNQTRPSVPTPDDTAKGKAPAAEVEDVPDPDEDDLDDLDGTPALQPSNAVDLAHRFL